MADGTLSEDQQKLFVEQMAALTDLRREIVEDIEECNLYRKEHPGSKFGNRLVVRTVFSSIEAYTNHLKQGCLALNIDERVKFSTIQKLALQDESFRVRDNGDVELQPLKISLIANISLAVSSFAQVENRTFKLDKSGQGFEAFKRAVKVRDRMMHPRDASAYQVSDEDVDDVIAAFSWFMTQIIELTRTDSSAVPGDVLSE